MKKLLIAYASKHGSTREIAEALARNLEELGLETDLKEVTKVQAVSNYDAVILGSAVYVSNLLKQARNFAKEFSADLQKLPVWLFTSGHIGKSLIPEVSEALQITKIVDLIGARGHKEFAGKIDRSQLGLGEKLITSIVNATEGDFRDWEEVEKWSHDIAEELNGAVPQK